MSQAPAHNSLAFLKGSNASTSSFDRLNTSSRSRSGSLMRVMSTHNPAPSTAMTRRFSEALPRSSFLHDQHDSTTLNPLSHYANPSTTSFSQLSDTNWANRLEDFELKDPIGKQH